MKRSSAICVVAAAGVAASASGEVIHAVSGSNLIWFDTTSPGTVHTVGPLGTLGGSRLTFNPSDNFLYTIGGPVNSTVLVRIDPGTGAGSVIASLPTGSYYEALEWVGSQNSLVVSQGTTPATSTLSALSLGGAVTPIVTNGRDNDFAVWDSTRDLFYVSDPNGVAQLVLTSLTSSSNTNLGAAAIADPVYSAASDCFYATIWQTNTLLKIQTNNGLAPITVTNLGTIGGGLVGGLAIVPAPGVSAALVLGTMGMFARRRRG